MKNGLLKAFSLILALSIMLTSMSIVVTASDAGELGIIGGNVELDLTNEGTVTISVIAKEELTFYGIEGSFDVNEGEINISPSRVSLPNALRSKIPQTTLQTLRPAM
jgi:hypothetical protein